MQTVSVIIPVYNVKPYLEEALDSVINQTYTELEILIVDDGSTDGSGEICDRYEKADARITVIHQTNQGLSAARNAGLDRMTGSYTAFLDPDDAYHPDYISAMMDVMARESPDIVVCRYTVHHASGRLMQEKRVEKGPSAEPGMYDRAGALRAIADGKINVSVWNKLYTSDLWKKIRYPVGHVYEDIDTTFRIVNISEKCCVMDRALYFHRKRPGSITATNSIRNTNDRIRAFSHWYAFVEKNIPGIFTKQDLIKCRHAQLNSMISAYIRFSGNTGKKNEIFLQNLRKRIIKEGRQIENYSFRTRAAYRMLVYCPEMLRIVYPPYHAVRKVQLWIKNDLF